MHFCKHLLHEAVMVEVIFFLISFVAVISTFLVSTVCQLVLARHSVLVVVVVTVSAVDLAALIIVAII
jgi:hypothetical protein